MIPYSFTITSAASATFFFSITLFLGVTGVGYGHHRDKFFQMLLPAGVPLYLAPLLVGLEAISNIARVFSLAVRLFANMLSGHALLKVLSSFVWAIILHPWGWWMPLYFIPLLAVLLVFILETFIAFLQTYVFMVLICVYLNDAICLH